MVYHRLQAKESIAVLTIQQEGSRVSIYDANQYFFTRSIPINSNMLLDSSITERSELADQLALEVQRTLDYFDSYYGKASVRKIYLLPDVTTLDWLTPELGSLVGLACELILPAIEGEVLTDGAALIPLAWGGLIGRMVS